MTFFPSSGGLFGQGAFQIDQNSTPEMIRAKREMLASMMPQYGRARYVGEGIGQLATGIATGKQRRALDKFEGERRQEAAGTFNNLLTGFGATPPRASAPQGAPQSAPMSILGMQPKQAPAPAPKPLPADTAPGPNQGIADAAMSAIGKPERADWLRYNNQQATRNQPISKDLQSALSFLPEMGVEMEVFSGGQPAKGSGGARVGSERHDHGNSADAIFYKDGRKLDWANPDDRPIFEEIVRRGRAAGLTGFGAGDGYMTPGSMHVGFGKEAVWGAGGRGENAPPWLRSAYTGDGTKVAQNSAVSSPQPGGRDVSDLAMMAQNPWLSAEQRAVVNNMLRQEQAQQVAQQQREWAREDALYKQQIAQQDPMYQAKLAQAQLDLEQDRSGNSGDTEYGLNPQYGVDAEGNPVIIQLGKDGTSTRTPLPEGVTFQKEPIKVDAGTEWILLDPISRQPVGRVEKNLGAAEEEKAIGKAIGESTGEAIANVGGTVAKAQQAIDLIQSIRDDPSLPGITGRIQGRIPPISQGGTDLSVKIKQMQGKVFLEAFESLKGGGQITEVEGAKAEAAMARLDRAQSTEAYQAALDELADVIRGGMARAQSKAGAPAQAATDFSQMTPSDLGAVDVMSLSDAELDAFEARMKELGL